VKVQVDDAPAFAFTAGKDLDPARPTALFVHGAGQDHTLWRLEVRRLIERGWNAVAVDLPGHGDTGGTALRSIREMACWTGSLMERLGIESAVLVGHSMGSLIALQLAADRPESVEGLVLTGTAPTMPVHPRLLELSQEGSRDAVELVVGWVHTGSSRMGRAVQPGSWEPGVSRRTMGRSLDVLANDLAACDAHRSTALDSVRCPVLVVAGALDRMTPVRSARELADMLPDGRLLMVERAGHDVPTRAVEIVVDGVEGVRRRFEG
jgi:pimeloyl-ACP methyl ester carboxylesterase